ncbi:uncharacterized protein LOC117182989 [Belonocnema kinseyi]|uniref:uncharacterized protein LOC117182989 n=1 Tax=Belonocnema kinseyi TaxID=2817044 RepID=UPI00143DE0D8|nr:uncharacterized protein LOC117182989 [Belonocnema kinseyi]
MTDVPQLGRIVLNSCHPNASEDMRRRILPRLHQDDVADILSLDDLLIIYGNNLCEKYKEQHLALMIKSRLRLMTRVYIAAKAINYTILDLKSMINPQMYKTFIQAIHKVAEFDEETDRYKKPNVASSIRTLMKDIVDIFINKCIMTMEDKKQKTAGNFLHLHSKLFRIRVNNTAKNSKIELNRRKIIQLPSLHDIKTLLQYTKSLRHSALKKSDAHGFSYPVFKVLAETCLLGMMIFNQRRPGEMQMVEVQDFKLHSTIDERTNKELFQSMSKQARKALVQYVRFSIRGKLNRPVTVVLCQDLLHSAKTILHHREEANIPASNKYIFELPSQDAKKDKLLDACHLMRKYSKACGAKEPHLLRAKKLRKHIATTCLQLKVTAMAMTKTSLLRKNAIVIKTRLLTKQVSHQMKVWRGRIHK